MAVSDAFRRYTEQVCQQIRWKKAHPTVAQEIENHLIDQKNAYLQQGDPESIAEEKTLLQMGDPVAVGAALDHTHKPAPQWGLLVLVLVLFLCGILLQAWIVNTQFTDANAVHRSLQSLLLYCPLGLALFFGAYFLDVSFLGRHPLLLPLLLLVYEVLCQWMGVSYGSARFFVLGPFTVGSGVTALLFPLAFCGILYRLRELGRRGYLLSGCAAAVCSGVLLLFHPKAGLVVFLFSGGLLLWTAARREWLGKGNGKYLLLFLGIALAALLCLLSLPQFRHRVFMMQAVLFPQLDPTGNGYLTAHLRELLANAQFLGQGLSPNGQDLTVFLPIESLRSDFLLTYLTYRFGWAVSIGVVGLLIVFLGWGFRKCLRQKSILGQMTALTILATLSGELLVYVLANLGLPLLAPLALPFLSYGGSALLCHMALAGLLLSVFRVGDVVRDRPFPAADEKKFIRWEDGKLILSFK